MRPEARFNLDLKADAAVEPLAAFVLGEFGPDAAREAGLAILDWQLRGDEKHAVILDGWQIVSCRARRHGWQAKA